MASELFQCDTCLKSFNTRQRYSQHLKTHSKPLICETCQRGFALRSDLDRHIKNQHRVGQLKYYCRVKPCRFETTRKDNGSRHLRKVHGISSQARKKGDSLGVIKNGELSRASHLSSASIEITKSLLGCSVFVQAATAGNTTLLETCLKAGFGLDTRASDGSTAMHCAARAGQAAAVQYLLEKGADVDITNDKSRVPLSEAILSQDPDTVRVLLRGITEPVSLPSIEKYLVQSGNPNIIQLLIEHLGTSFTIQDAQSLLAAASKAGQPSIISVMLNYPDIDINKEDTAGNAPIHQAAWSGRTEVMGVLLASNGIDPNNKTLERRMTPLHIAAWKGHFKIVDMLMSQDTIEVNSRDYVQHAPLHLAARVGHAKIAKRLLSHEGVDINCKSRGLQTPLHLSAQNGQLGVVELFLNHRNIDACCTDSRGQTPLDRAAFKLQWETVHMLLNHWEHSDLRISTPNDPSLERTSDAANVVRRLLTHPNFQDVNVTNKWGLRWNLLQEAVTKGECDVIRILLAHKDIDVNLAGRYGQRPLHFAVAHNKLDAAKLLLQHKEIDINYRDLYRYTALQEAKEGNKTDFVELLLSYGATDDDNPGSTTVTHENNVVDTSGLVGMQNNAQAEAELDVPSDSFMDESIDSDGMNDLEIDEFMDLDIWT